MSRNGAGIYSLPAGQPVVSGSVISSSVHNTLATDMATALSDSLTKDGQAVWSGTQDANGNKIVLDADGDTSIIASTDDIIDIEVEGVSAIKLGWQSVADTGFITLDPKAFTADTTENTHRVALLASNAITIPSGTTSLVTSLYVPEPNITATGTVTTAATVYIKDAPTEGATNYSLWVDAGKVQFDGTFEVTGAQTFTGVTTHGGNVISDTDSTDDLGTTSVRWLNTWSDTVTGTTFKPGTLVLAAGSITDTSGAITFGNENLTTTGTLATGTITIGTLVLAAGSITDTTNAIDFGNEALTTTGQVASSSVYTTASVQSVSGSATGAFYLGGNSLSTGITDATTKRGALVTPHYTNAEQNIEVIQVLAGSSTSAIDYGGGSASLNAVTSHKFYTAADNTTTTGTLALDIDSSQNFDFQAGNLVTTGTLGAGAATVTSVVSGTLTATSGSITDSSGAISFGNENLTTTGTAATGALTVTGAMQGSTTLGVGLTRTEGTVHIQTASAGSVTAPTNSDDLVVEGSTNTGIAILSPDASKSAVVLGSPTQSSGVQFDWQYSTGAARLVTVKVGATWELKADNAVTNLTLSGASGSELAAFAGGVTFAGVISGTDANGPALRNEVASSTNPTLLPNKSDTDTGIGWISSNGLSFIVGGGEVVRMTSSTTTINNDLTLSAGTLSATVASAGAVAILTQSTATSTNFHKYIDLGALTIWISDGTTAEGALTGVEGDICLNGGTGAGQVAFCDAAGTNWTDM